MNALKKIMSITSAVAVFATMAAMPVSATNSFDYDLSYETLTQAIETRDGDIIPAGSIAVTMSVENNAGFADNTFLLNIEEGYEVILDNDNKPIVEVGNVLDGFLVASALGDDRLCVSVASDETTRTDGSVFTVYCTRTENAQGSPATLGQLNNSASFTPENIVVPNTHIILTKFGDVNGDLEINASDASCVMIALNRNSGDDMPLYWFYYDEDMITLAHYFAECYADNNYCYVDADVICESSHNYDDYITFNDAYEILQYSACENASPGSYTGPGRFGPQLFDLDTIALA